MLFIRFENFMGDMDDLAEVNLIGPFPDRAARGAELARLDMLPLGAPEYNGGFLFHPVDGECRADRTVPPEQVAGATTIRGFFAAFHGDEEEDDDPEDDTQPDQDALFALHEWQERNHLHISYGGGPPTVIDVPPMPAAETD